MRTRATIAALSGALAIAALGAPAAHADDTYGNTKITKVSVTSGTTVTLGTSATKLIKVSVTATDDSGIKDLSDIHIWNGKSYLDPNGSEFLADDSTFKCKASSATTSTCTGTVVASPFSINGNDGAGTWHVGADVDANDGDWADIYSVTTIHVLRYDKIAASNASPEPIKKGKTLTVTSKLTRASWEDYAYHGYAQTAELQFKKKGTSTYKDVKAVKATSSGSLKTTTKASYDGYWRYAFKGSSTSPAISATSDYVDVK
jgi:hypothetical protein